MRHKEGDIVEYEGMKLRLEKGKYGDHRDCSGCAFEHHLMKYCSIATMVFGNFKFIEIKEKSIGNNK